MRLQRTLVRIVLPAALIAGGTAATAEAGQRTGRLSVSVQVVDTCSSTTTGSGASHACAGSTAPVAIVREVAMRDAATQPRSAVSASQVENEAGMVTIIY